MMMNNLQGKTLIVGDGDFSFTVAYATKRETYQEHLMSSTILSQADLFKLHKMAAAHLQKLKCFGVEVFYSVDATRLMSSFVPSCKIDNIIFNFPHAGGKSNLKRNRKLLKDFFQSAADFLPTHGRVCVTLARGQGGTPQDKPIRQWHDNWQVVAQAAFSGWILNEIDGFRIEDYPQYDSTGFRSMDRQFYTADSKTYIFRKAPRCYIGLHNALASGLPNSVQIARQRRERVFDDHHPVQMIKSEILAACKSKLPNLPIKDYSTTTLGVEEIMPQKSLCTKRMTSQTAGRRDPTSESKQAENDVNEMFVDYRFWHSNGNPIRSTLLESATVATELAELTTSLQLVHGRDPLCLAFGDCYRRAEIETDKHPLVMHNELILLKSHQHNSSKNQDDFREFVMSVLKHIAPPVSKFDFADSTTDDLPSCYQHIMSGATTVTCSYTSYNNFTSAACNQVFATGKADPSYAATLKNAEVTRVIGHWAQIELPTCAGSQTAAPTMAACNCFVVDLDALALCRFDIPDFRLLLSENPAVIEQFRSVRGSRSATEASILTYRAISLHPPLWRHDLSFWEPISQVTDESKLIDIIHDLAGDVVKQVLLMNVWRDPVTGLMSRCYRIVYQSLDKPLSHSDVHSIQNSVRLTVAKVLNVQLR